MALYLEDVALYQMQKHNIEQHDGAETSAEWETVKGQIQENWGGMYEAQMSLLYSVTGGADWGDLAEPFCTINRAHCCAYLIWVAVVLFGLINITVGIFARQAQEFHQWDRQLIVEGALQDNASMRATLMDLFDQMDHSGNGYLSKREITAGLESERIRAYFAQLNIDVEMHADQFFRLLDDDGNDRVDRDEFTTVCMRLQGGAKPLELQRIISGMEDIKRQLAEMAG